MAGFKFTDYGAIAMANGIRQATTSPGVITSYWLRLLTDMQYWSENILNTNVNSVDIGSTTVTSAGFTTLPSFAMTNSVSVGGAFGWNCLESSGTGAAISGTPAGTGSMYNMLNPTVGDNRFPGCCEIGIPTVISVGNQISLKWANNPDGLSTAQFEFKTGTADSTANSTEANPLPTIPSVAGYAIFAQVGSTPSSICIGAEKFATAYTPPGTGDKLTLKLTVNIGNTTGSLTNGLTGATL